MEENVQFNINGKVEIRMEDGDYKSIIQDVTDQYIAISIPTKEGSYVPLRPGEKVEVIYYFEKELYKFITVIIGRRIDRIPILLLSIPDKLEKIQRRRHVRIPVVVPIKYAKMNSKVELEYKKYQNGVQLNTRLNFTSTGMMLNISSKGIMLDISGGGVRVNMKDDLSYENFVLIALPLEDEDFIVKSKVVRVENQNDGQKVYGLRFIDLDEKDRDKIVKYIFKLMRDQRKKASEGV